MVDCCLSARIFDHDFSNIFKKLAGHISPRIIVLTVVVTLVIYQKLKHVEWVDFDVKASFRFLIGESRWANLDLR